MDRYRLQQETADSDGQRFLLCIRTGIARHEKNSGRITPEDAPCSFQTIDTRKMQIHQDYFGVFRQRDGDSLFPGAYFSNQIEAPKAYDSPQRENIEIFVLTYQHTLTLQANRKGVEYRRLRIEKETFACRQ